MLSRAWTLKGESRAMDWNKIAGAMNMDLLDVAITSVPNLGTTIQSYKAILDHSRD
jgi:hypothetical protein